MTRRELDDKIADIRYRSRQEGVKAQAITAVGAFLGMLLALKRKQHFLAVIGYTVVGAATAGVPASLYYRTRINKLRNEADKLNIDFEKSVRDKTDPTDIKDIASMAMEATKLNQ